MSKEEFLKMWMEKPINPVFKSTWATKLVLALYVVGCWLLVFGIVYFFFWLIFKM